MLKLLTLLATALLYLSPSIAMANESAVKEKLEAALGVKVKDVSKSPYLGLYEVFVDGQLLFVDEDVSTIFIGRIIDVKTRNDYSAERLQKLNAVDPSKLPLEQAVKLVHGKGERVLISFEDPNCGYCKRLAKGIDQVGNLTMYIFMSPILSDDSLKKSKKIWCASNRSKAWRDWMVENRAPTNQSDCDTSAIEKNIALVRSLGIKAVPTLFFANGERLFGASSIESIEQKLDENHRRERQK